MAVHPDPAQRTASTARALVLAGLACAAEAVWRGSAARTLVAAILVACGGGLLLAAKRAA
jgi:hypothetical protein